MAAIVLLFLHELVHVIIHKFTKTKDLVLDCLRVNFPPGQRVVEEGRNFERRILGGFMVFRPRRDSHGTVSMEISIIHNVMTLSQSGELEPTTKCPTLSKEEIRDLLDVKKEETMFPWRHKDDDPIVNLREPPWRTRWYKHPVYGRPRCFHPEPKLRKGSDSWQLTWVDVSERSDVHKVAFLPRVPTLRTARPSVASTLRSHEQYSTPARSLALGRRRLDIPPESETSTPDADTFLQTNEGDHRDQRRATSLPTRPPAKDSPPDIQQLIQDVAELKELSKHVQTSEADVLEAISDSGPNLDEPQDDQSSPAPSAGPSNPKPRPREGRSEHSTSPPQAAEEERGTRYDLRSKEKGSSSKEASKSTQPDRGSNEGKKGRKEGKKRAQ